MTTDTPRTDALETKYRAQSALYAYQQLLPLSRTLERELIASTEELAAALEVIEQKDRGLEDAISEIESEFGKEHPAGDEARKALALKPPAELLRQRDARLIRQIADDWDTWPQDEIFCSTVADELRQLAAAIEKGE